MANLLPFSIRDNRNVLKSESRMKKMLKLKVNLKTESLQRLLVEKRLIRNLEYTNEYTKNSYLRYQQGEPLEKISKTCQSSSKFFQSLFVFVTQFKLSKRVFWQMFSYDEISHKGLIPLSTNIRRCNILRKIDLTFEYYHITGIAENFLVSSIKISESELEDLSNSLNRQRFIKTLCLEFREDDVVSYEGGIYIRHFLKSFHCIQHLSLIFERSSIINGKGWFYLRQGLERLTTLKYLWLDFYSYLSEPNILFNTIIVWCALMMKL